MKLYPFTFKPIYKEKVWGGEQLRNYFGRELPGDSIGESWEIAAHKHGTSVIANGPLAGKNLDYLLQKNARQLLGKYLVENNKTFPLLVKFLSVKNKLSIQVHPDDAYAREHEGEPGKTEMWYVISAAPEARLIYGLKSGITPEELVNAIKNGDPETYLNYLQVNPGDVFFIPAGTLHSIKGEMLLAEIQQNSDTTYRVYDWGRTDNNGKSRPLHIKRALDVIEQKMKSQNYKPLASNQSQFNRKLLAACPYFITEQINIKGDFNLYPAGETFYIIINLQGNGKIKSHDIELQPGQTTLIPAECTKITVTGNCKFLLSYIAPRKEWLIDNLTCQGYDHSHLSTLVARTFKIK
ncbi:MAG: type I phosphomannose isomerase catalytic subunit [Halanaerobiales bacterium]